MDWESWAEDVITLPATCYADGQMPRTRLLVTGTVPTGSCTNIMHSLVLIGLRSCMTGEHGTACSLGADFKISIASESMYMLD